MPDPRKESTSRKKPNRRSDPLAMKIYSAFLGSLPRISRETKAPTIDDDTPFHAQTLGRQLRRAGGSVSRALDEARERLNRSTPAVPPSSRGGSSKPVVLIGSVAVRRRMAADAAASASRPAA